MTKLFNSISKQLSQFVLGTLFILLWAPLSWGFQLQQFSNYDEHRKQFDLALAQLTQFKIYFENWPVAADSKISTKAVLLQNKTKKQNRVIVMSSGIHGVESFVGSAIQIEFINSFLKNNANL